MGAFRATVPRRQRSSGALPGVRRNEQGNRILANETWPVPESNKNRPGILVLARAWVVASLACLIPSNAQAHFPQEPSAEAQQPVDADFRSTLAVSLVTVGAGDAVHEMFGHNAIRIRDEALGIDVSYNWGMFDFGQEGFFWRFLLGDWQYWMAGLPSDSMIEFYVESDRGVVEQELDLTPSQRRTLFSLAQLNARPENRFYRYQYFLDNCSTRVRDILDTILEGSLRERFTVVPGESYRFHTRRLTEGNAVLYVSLDFFMSARGDRPITAWDKMFIPMMLRDFLRETDLVPSEVVLDESSRPRPLEAPPRRFVWFALTGAVLAGLLAGTATLGSRTRSREPRGIASRTGRLGFVLVAGIWSLAMGLSGLVMIVSHFTSHEFMYWNENFLQATPLSLVLACALVPAVVLGRWRRLASRTALLAAGVSVVGFVMQVLPGIDQVNGYYLVVAVPAHLAVAWGLGEVAGRGPEQTGTG